MKKYIYIVPLILLCAVLLSSCAAKKRMATLKAHQSMLSRVSADQNLSAEAKMDSLASSFVRMMNEGLNITNPKKGIAYVKQYNELNKEAINSIVDQVVDYSASLEKPDRTKAAIRMARKPYAKELLTLIPKFKKKYAQIKFVAALTKRVRRGFGSFGGNLLDGLLDKL
jgi:hypothetical protein